MLKYCEIFMHRRLLMYIYIIEPQKSLLMLTTILHSLKNYFTLSPQKLNPIWIKSTHKPTNFAVYSKLKMKHSTLSLLLILFLGSSLQSGYAQPNEQFYTEISSHVDLPERVLEAIRNDDYKFVELALVSGQIDVNEYYNGKTYLIYASIYNKPEMVRLLFTLGADFLKRCDQGYLPIEHAKHHQAVYARAELIVLQA